MPSISSAQTAAYDEALYSALEYRSIGPYRGGRSAAVAGVPNKPLLYYFGATGGGVWRTQDGGQSWENLSDGFFGGSIGAVAVSEWDPNVIYVGGGEKNGPRQRLSRTRHVEIDRCRKNLDVHRDGIVLSHRSNSYSP